MKSALKMSGGKFFLADWIVSHFPDRKYWNAYREPYYGSGAVHFLINPVGMSETVNDISSNLMSFWECLQDEDLFAKFRRRIEATPFSQVEFERAELTLINPHASKLDKGIAYFVRNRQSRQALMRDFATPTTRLRRKMNEQVSAWLTSVDRLPLVHQRMKYVEIRNMEACDFIRMYDHPLAMFYLDPPYLHDTRTATDLYEHEMTYSQHCRLLNTLSKLKGKFALSGYNSSLYSGNAKAYGWRCETKLIDNKSSSKAKKDKKLECLWMNY